MSDAHDFLRNLALVLCVAAATTVVFQRLRQPVVFGYLLASVHYADELEAILRKISSAARLAIEETGTNMLWLVFGIPRLVRVSGLGARASICDRWYRCETEPTLPLNPPTML